MTEQIPLDRPEDALVRLGKHPDLIPYGGGNFGMPLSMLEPDGPLVTPTARFFLRSNGPLPIVNPETWRLEVGGLVERPLSLTLADLRAMPRRGYDAVLECAGNGRTGFDPLPAGTPWRYDAAGNAAWSGVPLAAVLDRAGVGAEAVDIVTQGGDMPGMQRGLPLAIARQPDTLLVLEMNGAPLTVGHGGPVRLLVPGWAGIASTKWLVGLTVLDRALDGFWNTDNYVHWSVEGDPLRPVAEMPVRSVISTPDDGAIVAAGPMRLAGYAWSGFGAIRTVEVSGNDGATWKTVPFRGGGRRAWVRWETTWQAAPGETTLMVRATDERGLRQPRRAVWNRKGYQQNGIQTVRVRTEG
ncbi:MAG: sulfite oxidase [Thermomicrobiales bacterium]|nr:sulfite oxidase [Thermomicrobiales bacterium]